MSDIESRIDELFQGPADQFVAARNALAKELKGPDAQRVKALQKPTLVPWTVNQVYWHAQPLYLRLIQSGEQLRRAQIAALEGRAADVRAATQAHREAVGKATAKGLEMAAAAGASPSADDIGRTFETLSLAGTAPDHPGRLTAALAPAGFEALGGIAVKPPVPRPAPAPVAERPLLRRVGAARETGESHRAQKAREEQEAATARQRAAAVKKAQSAVDRASAAEAKAREDWHRAKRALEAAERSLSLLE